MFPTATVDSVGHLNIFFYDRRDNPKPRKLHQNFHHGLVATFCQGKSVRHRSSRARYHRNARRTSALLRSVPARKW